MPDLGPRMRVKVLALRSDDACSCIGLFVVGATGRVSLVVFLSKRPLSLIQAHSLTDSPVILLD